MRREPRTGEQDRRPPPVREKDGRGRQPTDHLDEARGDELHGDRKGWAGHAQVEVAGDLEVVRELGVLEMAHALRFHARVGELVVEPCRGAVAEVGAECRVDRVEDLEQYEDEPDSGERRGQRVAVLNRADEHAHRYRERGGQNPAQHEHSPPRDGQGRVGPVQDPEELPFLTIADTTEQPKPPPSWR